MSGETRIRERKKIVDILFGPWFLRDRDVLLRHVEIVSCPCPVHCGAPSPVLPRLNQLMVLLWRDPKLVDVSWDGKHWCPTVTRN